MILNYNIKVYYFKQTQTKDVVDSLYADYRTNIKKREIIRDDDDFMFNSIYLEITDNDSLVFCTDEHLKRWLLYFDLIGYEYVYHDACNLLFNNKLDLSLADDTMKKIIEQYIIDNFEVNDVLDKMINKVELTEVDYKILKK